ncbi:cell division control protein Cdc6 [Ascobolus immersus RN42]|uniref:Cell division control protein Cdc6 n=1 Tax=Ascobolus immersus RN42 TaxID=1160509 RepID=A0A3N4IJS9_ASCIM|nr:cell division control protein Cdc6 [Ascobolus immersus RN42]
MSSATVLGKRVWGEDVLTTPSRRTRRRAGPKEQEQIEIYDSIILESPTIDEMKKENIKPVGKREPLSPLSKVNTQRREPLSPLSKKGNAMKKTDPLSPSSKVDGSYKVTKAPAKPLGLLEDKTLNKISTQPQVVIPQTPKKSRTVQISTPRHRVQVGSRPATPRTPRTPSRAALTPRHQNIATPSKSATVFTAAKALFTRSAAPGDLVGREEEKAELTKLIKDCVDKKQGNGMYVSGPPGTGKSATVGRIVEDVCKELDVTHVNINCVTMKDEKELYARLLDEFWDESKPITSENGAAELESIFVTRSKTSPLHVLILDEIDHLLTRDQSLLTTLFTWSLVSHSHLLLIGIANALDLTSRFLPRLKAQSLTPILLPFKPYSAPQIASVISSRFRSLPTPDLFHPAAIQLAARKVASSTGDLRKAFDIVRGTLDLAEADWRKSQLNSNPFDDAPAPQPKVLLSHVARYTSAHLTTSTPSTRLAGLTIHQKLALTILALLSRSSSQVSFQTLHSKYSLFCRKSDMAPLSKSEFGDIISGMEGVGVLTVAEVGAITPSKRRKAVGMGAGKLIRCEVGGDEVGKMVETGNGSGLLFGLWKGGLEEIKE